MISWHHWDFGSSLDKPARLIIRLLFVKVIQNKTNTETAMLSASVWLHGSLPPGPENSQVQGLRKGVGESQTGQTKDCLTNPQLQLCEQARKLSRCDSYLRNLKLSPTHWLTGVSASRCNHIYKSMTRSYQLSFTKFPTWGAPPKMAGCMMPLGHLQYLPFIRWVCALIVDLGEGLHKHCQRHNGPRNWLGKGSHKKILKISIQSMR